LHVSILIDRAGRVRGGDSVVLFVLFVVRVRDINGAATNADGAAEHGKVAFDVVDRVKSGEVTV
jgi:hypothetical protein